MHYAVGWITIGALLVHVAVKLPLIVAALRRPLGAELDAEGTAEDASAGLTRRGVLVATGVASGAALVATAGAAVPALRRVSVFAVTSGGGPGGVPINTTAHQARVVSAALSPGFRLVVVNGGVEVAATVAELEAMPQTSVELPIACVEGWSASGRWHGVRISELLALVDARPESTVAVTSLQESGPFRSTQLPADFAADPLSLLAVGLDGEPLSLDHGYPCRLIAPNRPGVLQTKWVRRLEVVT
jgi:DMSO/TMAO reductase YedYZ molybdopterin-dependent catalytic subunit